MSRYAVTDNGELIVSWPTGHADHALVLPQSGLSTAGLAIAAASATTLTRDLAAALSALSAQLWRTYTHPASGVPDEGDHSEHWRRTQHRTSLDNVADLLAAPNLPDENGNLLSSYDPVIATANQIGCVLHDIDDAALTRTIRDDVAAEVAAVQQAELDNLAGRATQAVA